MGGGSAGGGASGRWQVVVVLQAAAAGWMDSALRNRQMMDRIVFQRVCGEGD